MLLYFLAMAQTSSESTDGSKSGSGIWSFLPFILIILIFYLLLIRPQAKRQKKHQAMLQQLKKGDKIVTSGGIHGVIVGQKENTNILIVKVADKVKVEVERSSVARSVPGGSQDELKGE